MYVAPPSGIITSNVSVPMALQERWTTDLAGAPPVNARQLGAALSQENATLVTLGSCVAGGGFAASIIGVMTAALIAGALLANLCGRQRRTKLEQADFERHLKVIERALDEHRERSGGSGGMQYPMVLVAAHHFLAMEKLLEYEVVRRKGGHIMLDSMRALRKFEQNERIVFFSHREQLAHLRRTLPLPILRRAAF
jgi:hypothetical protein